MRKIVFYLALLSLAIISCKKEHGPGNSAATAQKVVFTVGFAQSSQAITNNNLTVSSLHVNAAPDTSLTNHINIIYYTVFDAAGNQLHNIYQVKGDTSFGHYTDNLHPGNYTVAISAGTDIGVASGAGDINGTFIYGPGGVNSSQGFVSDVFFKRLNITVANTTLNQNISLNRLTSRLIININDAIPANSNYASINISNVASRYYVGTDQVINVSGPGNNFGQYDFIIPVSAGGTKNYRIVSDFMYLGDFNVNIEIGQQSNNSTTVFGSKSVSNVTGAPNKITLLSGNLFGGSGTNATGGFQVTTDTTWNPAIVKTF